MRVARWGNSLAVRLPAAVVEALELVEGDDVELVFGDERLLEVRRSPTRDEMIARLDRFAGSLPRDFKFDRDEANER